MVASIPASDIVNILPNVIGAGGSGLDLVGLILTNSTRPPVGSVLRFSSAASVSAYFGASAQETTLATIYFAGFTGATIVPASLLFVQYPSVAVPAYLRGGNPGLTLAQLKALTPSTIALTIDGRSVTSGSIDLSAASSFSNAASIIQTALADKDASFTGVIAVTTGILTASAVTGTLAPGQTILGSGVPAGTTITSQLTGTTGAAGTYQTNITTAVSSTAMTSGPTLVTYDSQSGAFVITAGTPETGTITYATTAALATSLALTQATGAVISQGAPIGVPGTAMDAVIASTQDFSSFMTTWEPATDVALAFAAWTDGQNNRYKYVSWDTDIVATQNPDTASLGYQIRQLEYSGTSTIYAPTNGANMAAFEMGIGASVNYQAVNGRTTFAFRTGSGLVADVSNQTIAANLKANGYNFYGSYATANAQFTFYYPGQISGPFGWLDSYDNEIWMNNNFQLSLLQMLLAIGDIPYNADGNALIEAVMQGPIDQALIFGAIKAGITLTPLQAQEVNTAAGRNVADTIQQRGWYALVQPASAEVRAARGSPPVFFWYTDGQSINMLTVSSVLIQ